jgi:hypothetical protein
MATVTPWTRHNTAYSFLSAQHYGILIQEGTYTPSTGTTQYTSVGDLTTFPGFSTHGPVIVLFGWAGYTTGLSTFAGSYQYDNTNRTVRWLNTSTGGLTEATTADSREGMTAAYLAIGR